MISKFRVRAEDREWSRQWEGSLRGLGRGRGGMLGLGLGALELEEVVVEGRVRKLGVKHFMRHCRERLAAVVVAGAVAVGL